MRATNVHRESFSVHDAFYTIAAQTPYKVRFIRDTAGLFDICYKVLLMFNCVPKAIFMYKSIKNFHVASRQRLKANHLELEELKLQLEIVNTKQSVCESEFVERGELLRRKLEDLRKVQLRVREIITGDEVLRNIINDNEFRNDESFFNSNNNRTEEVTSKSRNIVELIREMKYDQDGIPDMNSDMLSSGDPSREPATAESCIYSTAADGGKQDCHVKIVKITNVYRVAYLRHIIKQKRLRRANRQALLRKKMDNIKNLLDDWHNTLSMVINSKLTHLYNSPQVDLASQEAMGDCSKPLYNSSDSDSDFINSTDNFHDNYSVSWTQNQYPPVYAYNNYDDFPANTAVSPHEEQHERNTGILYIVPEETTSQMEIKEIESDDE